ncbi:reverse transcriptase domain-containing protein [Tanacetum coccineum]
MGPTEGHYGADITARKIFESGFYWPNIFKDAARYIRECDACQRAGNISSHNQMPLTNILVSEVFDILGIDFIGPFPSLRNNKYILMAVDYVSKWVGILEGTSEQRQKGMGAITRDDALWALQNAYKIDTYWWHDQKLEEDERREIGVDIEGIDGCFTIGKRKRIKVQGDDPKGSGHGKEGPNKDVERLDSNLKTLNAFSLSSDFRGYEFAHDTRVKSYLLQLSLEVKSNAQGSLLL